jgi:hypothetical protein
MSSSIQFRDLFEKERKKNKNHHDVSSYLDGDRRIMKCKPGVNYVNSGKIHVLKLARVAILYKTYHKIPENNNFT